MLEKIIRFRNFKQTAKSTPDCVDAQAHMGILAIPTTISGVTATPIKKKKKKKKNAGISIPPKIFPFALFINVWFSFIFLYNDCISNISALNSFQQQPRFYFNGNDLMHSRNRAL